MVTATMTDVEIRKEMCSELGKIYKYVDNKCNYYRRTVVKSKTFPLYFEPIEYTSSRNNKYLFLFNAIGKRYPNDLNCVCVCLFERGGINAMMLTDMDGKAVVLLHSAHLFSRYRKRFLKNESLSNLDVIKRYFKINNNVVYNEEYSDFCIGGRLIGTTKEGIVFGVLKAPGVIVLKTFVSFEMLTKWQSMTIEMAYKYLLFLDKNNE